MPCPPEVPYLLRALGQCVSLISERSHERLLQRLLVVNMWACSDAVAASLADLLASLVSAQAACLTPCLEMLVRNFVPSPAGSCASPAPPAPAEERRVLGHVHAALGRILALVPLAPSALLPVLLRRLPHRRLHVSTQLLFLRSLWRLAEGPCGAVLRDGILLAVVDRILELDLEVFGARLLLGWKRFFP